MQTMSEVIETRVICKQKDKYIGWPTVGTAPGSFLSVYYQKDRAEEKPCLVMTRWKG